MKRRPTWTLKHYLPVLYGAVAAGVYAQLAIHLPVAARFGQAPVWLTPVVAQLVFWIAVWLGRRTHFD